VAKCEDYVAECANEAVGLQFKRSANDLGAIP
jgi:hypothetical protein